MNNNDNTVLNEAKKNKKDEFYTRYEDIEQEISHYENYFINKTVYCNCDDPYKSNFVKYFIENFNSLKLKRLLCSGFNEKGKGIALDTDRKENKIYELEWNGDFRSCECEELLEQADIVCTNPPFSLLNEYILQLEKYNKLFLIIGNQNDVANKPIVPLLVENKLWMGYGFKGGIGYFESEYDNKTKAEEGLIRLSFVRWLTNMDIPRHHEFYKLTKCYKGNEEKYPKYDNYDIINVDRYSNIPKDYKGVMGVPITFMSQYCPEQFELYGTGGYHIGKDGNTDELSIRRYVNYINGKRTYNRVLIKNKHPEEV